jgi:hypothetical protein
VFETSSKTFFLVFVSTGEKFLFHFVSVKVYRTVILPLVLYGCEIWSLTSREEHRLRVFENRGLSRIFESKTDEITGERRRPHNEEHRDLYSPNIIRVIKFRMR